MASEESVNSHKAHMSKYLSQFTGDQKSTSKIISEDKFMKIVDHVKSSYGKVDPKLCWWAKNKNMLFLKIPHNLGITFYSKNVQIPRLQLTYIIPLSVPQDFVKCIYAQQTEG